MKETDFLKSFFGCQSFGLTLGANLTCQSGQKLVSPNVFTFELL